MLRWLRPLIPSWLRPALRAAKFHLFNRGFTPYVTEFERDGKNYRFLLGDRAGEAWFKGGWDWTEVNHLRDHVVAPGDVVLDCGAHHGEMMLLFSTWVGETGHVTSFEPVPRNAEIVRKQIELNQLGNVTFHQAAVGKEKGTIRMSDESNAQVLSGSAGVETPVVRVDDFAHLQPTLLKIDVEGFEAEVLKGAQEVLKRRPKLAIEIHMPALTRYGTSFDEVMALAYAEHYTWTYQYSGDSTIQPWRGEPLQERIIHMFGLPNGRDE